MKRLIVKLSKKSKIIISAASAVVILAAAPFAVYLKVLPWAVANPEVINYTESMLKKYAGLDLNVVNPVLKTSIKPDIDFEVDELSLSKGKDSLLSVKNFDVEVSFDKIFDQVIKINKLGADDIYADVNKLMALVPQQETTKPKEPSKWFIDLFDSILYVKNSKIIYDIDSKTHLVLIAKNLGIDNTKKDLRFVHFDIATDIEKDKKHLNIAIADKNTVYIKNKKLYIQDTVLNINKSKIFIKADASRADGFRLAIYSPKIEIPDVIELIESNIIENNLSEVLAYFKDLKGSFNFNIKLTKHDLDGVVGLNSASFKVVPVCNLPVTLTKGNIKMNKTAVTLNDFEGYYNNKKANKMDFHGIVTDYLKSIDTKVEGNAVVTNDFAVNYFSKLVGMPITLVGGNTKTQIKLASKYNKIDLTWLFGLKPGQDILIDGQSLTPPKFIRGLKADLHFEDTLLNIKTIDYYILPEQFRETFKEKNIKPRPVVKLRGNIDVATPIPTVKDLGFEVPNPLPSEFLNVLIGQKLFRKGKFSGYLSFDNNGEYPVLKGNMDVEGIRIPSQRLRVNKGKLITENGLLRLSADGKYKRTGWDFSGDFVNALKFPIVIKDINLAFDNVDVERFLAASNAEPPKQMTKEEVAAAQDMSDEEIENSDAAPTFDVSNLIIENCDFSLANGIYKDIKFGNVKAKLTLDKNSNLSLFSNRFDFAEGHTSGKVDCDLKNHKYKVILGIKDVNSDVIASTLLNLKREISGKGSGLIVLETDKSMKLNGSINFIIKNGQIQKIGLVEYVMKFAALFRNPLAMISPSTVSDLVNIPEGYFDDITGKILIKNNIIEAMQIKSKASQLSAYIVGRYDLETGDATLRIYTKFSSVKKGFAGFLRNISLNSLANRVPLSSRNDANYYAAELKELPPIDADEKDCQIFLTKVDGDVVNNNFLSSLKKIK